ncbi:hypothetical protein M885DRAFT_513170 [Pelagophyceae sp. CCMP2097]|nr:hypothetical protein M885DRAFT_513170 [Pelagophyceae sp. CCMP2097]|mmetsp:Transcript_11500/g.40508  ORF Transcript_11500/g.40508 Transcript_11500/m.40508 type:complete len:502 (+) Transcript_11500:123-1628(+)
MLLRRTHSFARCLPRSLAVRASSAPATESFAPRGAYAVLTAADVNAFRGMCDVLTDGDALARYNRDWMGKWIGNSSVVLRPRSTAEVSQILRHCNDRKIAVVPQGGNTGLVGGSVPVHDEVVLSLTLMNEIEALDADSGVVTLQAGVILEQLEAFLQPRGFTAPLDLGAKGTCTLGGNLATNAGGIRFLRYGSLRGSVVGLEAVLADGTVLDMLGTLRKDNTGYALPQLLIGAEGTLGVITRISLAAAPAPAATSVAWLACGSFEAVRETLHLARRHCAEILSAVEFCDEAAVLAVLRHERALDDPVSETGAGFRVLVETRGSSKAHDVEKLETFLSAALESGHVLDGVVADSETKKSRLWRLREGVSDAMTSAGYVYKYDVSLPLADMYGVVDEARLRLADFGANAVVTGYGHIGDSNLHLNVGCAGGRNDAVLALLEPWVFERVSGLGGSISAEHGIGQCKPQYLHLAKSPAAIALMRSIKATLDPNAILNPYKVLPPT